MEKGALTLAILAPGLLGASLGAASKTTGLAQRVQVWARRPEVRERCREQFWCDACPDTPGEAVRGADLVWLCAPVASISSLLQEIVPFLEHAAIVSDVGSTKAQLVKECCQILNGKAVFIGSHPMAGSERSGMEAADAELYLGKPCFVTPCENDPPEAVQCVVSFWEHLGMQVHQVSPEQHDRIVAWISHLPHFVASSLSALVGDHASASWSSLIGSGFLDTTRVASGSVPMWRDIAQHNRGAIMHALMAMEQQLGRLRHDLEQDRMSAVVEVLEKGKEYRDSLLHRDP